MYCAVIMDKGKVEFFSYININTTGTTFELRWFMVLILIGGFGFGGESVLRIFDF